MIKTLSKSIREYKKYAILSPIFVMAEVVFEVLIPFVMADMLDNGIRVGDNKRVLICGILMFIMAVISLVFGVLSGKVASTASAGFAKNIREDMYKHIQDYSFEDIDSLSTASLVTRLTNDVTNIELSFQMIIRIVVRAPFMLILAFVMSFVVNYKLALIFLAAVPFLGITLFLVMRKSFVPFSKLFKQYDNLNRTVEENLNGIRVVKSFVTENREEEKFKNESGILSGFAQKAEQILAWNLPIVQFTVYLCMLLIAFFGSELIINGFYKGNELVFMTTGELNSFFSYVMQILMSLMMISQIFVMLSMSKTSANRIVEVLNLDPTIKNKENPITAVKSGDILFTNVSFKYNNESPKFNLENVNCYIKEGETIGIIGGTGSAKSTFVQLIPRLYDVTEGSIKVGGVDVRDYDIETLRNSVAYVLQKNVLFSGTIKENLLWGNLDATDEEIEKACKDACAYDFIMTFPQKFDHDLGEGGVNVSGGQKQRLCIARALLKKPKVLILDDSTSAVDTKTDFNIRQALKNNMKDVTKFIIAQRISSVEDADRIFVFDDGKIIASGTHEYLLENCDIYHEINDLQKKGGNEDATKE